MGDLNFRRALQCDAEYCGSPAVPARLYFQAVSTILCLDCASTIGPSLDVVPPSNSLPDPTNLIDLHECLVGHLETDR
jgi:hypothetical protein